MKKLDSNRSMRGFTLIELLTVFAVMAILMAVLFPTISNIRVNAKITQSTSNLREIGKIVQLFRLDNNNLFPLTNDAGQIWIRQLWPYSNPNQDFPEFGPAAHADVFKDTIYYTPMVETAPNARAFGFNGILSNQVVREERDSNFQYSDSSQVALVGDVRTSSSLTPAQVNFRNRGKAHILFVDGHVESRSSEEVPDSTFSYFWRGMDHPNAP